MTIGNPNYFLTFKLSDDSLLNLNIMDTAGQEKFRAMNLRYYKKADCCILVYDIRNRGEFNEIKDYFIVKVKELCKKNVKVILVGNKTDLEDKREISYEEGINLAYLNNYLFIETSCLKNENVYEAFEKIIEIYLLSFKYSEEKIKEYIKQNLKKEMKIESELCNKNYIDKLLSYLNY